MPVPLRWRSPADWYQGNILPNNAALWRRCTPRRRYLSTRTKIQWRTTRSPKRHREERLRRILEETDEGERRVPLFFMKPLLLRHSLHSWSTIDQVIIVDGHAKLKPILKTKQSSQPRATSPTCVSWVTWDEISLNKSLCQKLSMIIGCNIWMACLELNYYFYNPSWMLQLFEFVWTLRSSA